MHCVDAVCTRSPVYAIRLHARTTDLVIMRVYARYMRGRRKNVRKIDILV